MERTPPHPHRDPFFKTPRPDIPATGPIPFPLPPQSAVPAKVRETLDRRDGGDASGVFAAIPAEAPQQALTPLRNAAVVPLPEADPSLMDDDHAEAAGSGPMPGGVLRDGTSATFKELESRGYWLIGRAWFSPKERRRGLHTPPRGKYERVSVGGLACLRETLPPTNDPVRAAARPKLYTQAQFDAARDAAAVRRATERFGSSRRLRA